MSFYTLCFIHRSVLNCTMEEKKHPLSFISDRINFYSRYAKINRFLYKISQTIIIITAAITPILAALETRKLNEVNGLTYTIISSSILAIFEGLTRLFRFRDLWLRYRHTANLLLREKRLFDNGIDKLSLIHI